MTFKKAFSPLILVISIFTQSSLLPAASVTADQKVETDDGPKLIIKELGKLILEDTNEDSYTRPLYNPHKLLISYLACQLTTKRNNPYELYQFLTSKDCKNNFSAQMIIAYMKALNINPNQKIRRWSLELGYVAQIQTPMLLQAAIDGDMYAFTILLNSGASLTIAANTGETIRKKIPDQTARYTEYVSNKTTSITGKDAMGKLIDVYLSYYKNKRIKTLADCFKEILLLPWFHPELFRDITVELIKERLLINNIPCSLDEQELEALALDPEIFESIQHTHLLVNFIREKRLIHQESMLLSRILLPSPGH